MSEYGIIRRTNFNRQAHNIIMSLEYIILLAFFFLIYNLGMFFFS